MNFRKQLNIKKNTESSRSHPSRSSWLILCYLPFQASLSINAAALGLYTTTTRAEKHLLTFCNCRPSSGASVALDGGQGRCTGRGHTTVCFWVQWGRQHGRRTGERGAVAGTRLCKKGLGALGTEWVGLASTADSWPTCFQARTAAGVGAMAEPERVLLRSRPPSRHLFSLHYIAFLFYFLGGFFKNLT